MPDEDSEAELQRRFDAAVSGMELADLRDLAGAHGLPAGEGPPASRPHLRRPARGATSTYRLRVDVDHADPVIWRLLDLRSDLTLDLVHEVLQAAFGWSDSHLHRFALGGSPFDRRSELFLCPFDVAQGEDEGTPANDVRLDEVVQDPGDVLRYVYDYGDDRELILRLEEVSAIVVDAPRATCVAGERAAPPEDSGGMTTAKELEDPDAFDPDEVNHALHTPFLSLGELGVDVRLVGLLHRLRFISVGEELVQRTVRLATDAERPTEEVLAAALRPHLWFLDRARGGGLELTAAGYLRPADAEVAATLVPRVAGWIGKNNREANMRPLLDFRQSLQSAGLLRKRKGVLLLTRAGAAADREPLRLWQHLAERLLPGESDAYVEEATLLLLVCFAEPGSVDRALRVAAEALGHLGWRRTTGPLQAHDLRGLSAYAVLANVAEELPDSAWRNEQVSPAAAALAREALRL